MEIFGIMIPLVVFYGLTRFSVAFICNWDEIKPQGQYKELYEIWQEERKK